MNIIDLHCDTIWKIREHENYSFYHNNGHVSEKNLLDGGYIAQCFAIFTPIRLKGEEAFNYFEDRYNFALNLFSKSENINIITNKNEINNNINENKISAILTVENAEFLNENLDRLFSTDKRGFKIFGLVHNAENCIGFSHNFENENMGLKNFGRDVIDAINDTDMLVDVSHLNCGGFWDVIKLSKKPVIATHSACNSIFEHSRNLYDEQIKAIANSGGVVGVPFYSRFLKDGNKTEIYDILHHVDHLIKIGGVETPAIGTDFDGISNDIFIKNSAGMQILAYELEKKFGFNIAEKICFKNALRLF